MKKRIFLPAVAGLILWLLTAWLARAACINQPLRQGQDPQIAYQDGYFNMVQSDGCNVRLFRATSLASLATAGNNIIYGAGCSNVWAPEIHWVSSSNCWFVYYSADTGAAGAERVHVIQSTGVNPYGPYIDRGVLLSSYWNIDGSIFTAANGQTYFIYSGSPSGTQKIYISAMSNPYTLSGTPVLLSSPDQAWEQNGSVNEGPYGFVHNGRTFIVYSASGCWTDDYCLGLLTLSGSNPLNAAAWTKSGPVFSKQPTAYGPGHNCVFEDGYGQWWNVYHANNVSGQGCGGYRQLRAQRIFWQANNTPYFGTPVPTNSLVVEDTNYLVAQYPLTGTSGTMAATTTCGPAGQLVGSPVWQNPGLKFNGSTDYVNCGSALGNDVQSALTLAAWIKVDSFIDWAGILVKGTNTSPFAMQIWSDGSLRFSANWGNPSGAVGSGSWNSSFKLQTNQWYHVAVTYDGQTLRFYTNGVMDSYQPALSLHFGMVDEPMILGADFPGGDEYFSGTIRDARLYGRALAPSEINLITGINHAPSLPAIPDQNLVAGQTLTITNVATDPEAPPQLLIYSLSQSPTGASIGGLTGVLSWRPAASQADSTNDFTVRVADTGSPSLSATQSFKVTVDKLRPPVVSAPGLSHGLFQMMVNGDYGLDYQIWSSTNLTDWQMLFQSNSPLLPFLWTDAAASNTSAQFYRLQLSP